MTVDGGGRTNTGHGHVWERPDGFKAHCDGPGICAQCSKEAALLEQQRKERVTDRSHELGLRIADNLLRALYRRDGPWAGAPIGTTAGLGSLIAAELRDDSALPHSIQKVAERVADAWFKYEFEHGKCSGFEIREKLGGLIVSELRAGVERLPIEAI